MFLTPALFCCLTLNKQRLLLFDALLYISRHLRRLNVYCGTFSLISNGTQLFYEIYKRRDVFHLLGWVWVSHTSSSTSSNPPELTDILFSEHQPIKSLNPKFGLARLEPGEGTTVCVVQCRP